MIVQPEAKLDINLVDFNCILLWSIVHGQSFSHILTFGPVMANLCQIITKSITSFVSTILLSSLQNLVLQYVYLTFYYNKRTLARPQRLFLSSLWIADESPFSIRFRRNFNIRNNDGRPHDFPDF